MPLFIKWFICHASLASHVSVCARPFPRKFEFNGIYPYATEKQKIRGLTWIPSRLCNRPWWELFRRLSARPRPILTDRTYFTAAVQAECLHHKTIFEKRHVYTSLVKIMGLEVDLVPPALDTGRGRDQPQIPIILTGLVLLTNITGGCNQDILTT